MTSAESRAAISLLMASWVATKTFPPMCPHFFADDNWSSKWTAAAPALIICLVSSNALRLPPNPASASATIGTIQLIE